jgi:hypothetical protein
MFLIIYLPVHRPNAVISPKIISLEREIRVPDLVRCFSLAKYQVNPD